MHAADRSNASRQKGCNRTRPQAAERNAKSEQQRKFAKEHVQKTAGLKGIQMLQGITATAKNNK